MSVTALRPSMTLVSSLLTFLAKEPSATHWWVKVKVDGNGSSPSCCITRPRTQPGDAGSRTSLPRVAHSRSWQEAGLRALGSALWGED